MEDDEEEEYNNGLQDLLSDKRRYKTERTRKAWEPHEDEALFMALAAYSQGDTVDWVEVSSHVPGRSHASCHQRYTKVLRPGLKKGNWSMEEDDILLGYLDTHTADSVAWNELSKLIEGRTPKQCRERWKNVLDPVIQRGRWDAEEDDLLYKLYARFGPSWAVIAKQMQGRRNENMVKNRWKRLGETVRGEQAHKAFEGQLQRVGSAQDLVGAAVSAAATATAVEDGKQERKRSKQQLLPNKTITPQLRRDGRAGNSGGEEDVATISPRAPAAAASAPYVVKTPRPAAATAATSMQEPNCPFSPIFRQPSPGLSDGDVSQSTPYPMYRQHSPILFWPGQQQQQQPLPSPMQVNASDGSRMRRMHSLDEQPTQHASSVGEISELLALQETLASRIATDSNNNSNVDIAPPAMLRRIDSFYEENLQLVQAALAAAAANNHQN